MEIQTVLRDHIYTSFGEQIISKDKMISEHIFERNGAYCVFFHNNTYGFEKNEEYHSVSHITRQSQSCKSRQAKNYEEPEGS